MQNVIFAPTDGFNNDFSIFKVLADAERKAETALVSVINDTDSGGTETLINAIVG